MKRLFLAILSVIAMTACGVVAGDSDFNFEGIRFKVAGMVSPKQYQEIHRLSYEDADGETTDAQLTFKDGIFKLVLPGGGFRTGKYSLDEENKTISFESPLIYGTKVYDGEDIIYAKYQTCLLMGTSGIAIFDPSLEDYDQASLEDETWRLIFTKADKEALPELYELGGEYGTMGLGYDLSDELSVAFSFVYDDAEFAWTSDCDLATVHYGPEWRLPSAAEGQWILENKERYIPWTDSAKGFWLADGSAVVLSDGVASIITPESGAKYCVFPVK